MSDSIRAMRERAAMLGAPGLRKCSQSVTEEERCRLRALDDVESALNDNGYGSGRELARIVEREKSTVQQWLSGAEHMKQFPLWALYRLPRKVVLAFVDRLLAALESGEFGRDSLPPTGTHQ